MTNHQPLAPLIVYLDTSDYSRFADCLSGRGDEAIRRVWDQLLEFKRAGAVRFAYSMAVISELLQYEGGGRELTLRKARVIDQLCNGSAFRYFSDLFLLQVVEAARRLNLLQLPVRALPTPLSSNNAWHPSVRGAVSGMRRKIREAIDQKVAEYPIPNRKMRRQINAKIKRLRFEELHKRSPEYVEALTREYPVSEEMARVIFPRFVDGRLTEVEFEEKLFAEVTSPPQFVIWYFERHKGEKDIPQWMRGFGEALRRGVLEVRQKTEGMPKPPNVERIIRTSLSPIAANVGRRLLNAIADDMRQLGIGEQEMASLSSDNLLRDVPYLQFLSQILPEYFLGNTGLRKQGRSPKPSDGGDIIHAIHIPYCDLWRGDSYFASLVRQTTPVGRCEVVQSIAALPGAIERRLST